MLCQSCQMLQYLSAKRNDFCRCRWRFGRGGHEAGGNLPRQDSYSQAKDISKVYEGWNLGCSIDYTVVRGRVVMENGDVDESAAGWGKFIKPVLKA